ncbi:hypothetical protein [Brazilian marseillevirus]|uniref:hypothetical protein n=1 Tax=Brazilian marseillevirus TaxID=1813599 RepID=UPI000781A294|nr:hypothetical protein A3303_gp216 [Brazilian marseillevirus]AMQ10724.1 hypothetical protein [Brazilian marseillevirus]
MDHFLEMFETLHYNLAKGMDITCVPIGGKDKLFYIIPDGTGKITELSLGESMDRPIIMMLWKKDTFAKENI